MSEFDPEEVRRCIELLERIVEDRTILTGMSDEHRVALMSAAGRVALPMRHENKALRKAFNRVRKAEDKARDRAARATTEIRAARRAEVFVPPPQLRPARPPEADAEQPELRTPRNCYVCKAEFRRLHFFYDAMCGKCGELNYAKRFQTARLDGKVAVITGARVKIGFQAALKMLRAGAHVIVTTRFPRDAAERFGREADFEEWSTRLEIHGLDLRHSPSVEIFARHLERTKDRLDILISNAAQTVRRPPGFYGPLLAGEQGDAHTIRPALRGVLRTHEEHKAELGAWAPAPLGPRPNDASIVAWHGAGPGIGIHASAELSQIPCASDEGADARALFPEGRFDADLQQIDLRTMNSWRMTLDQVPSAEMIEVHLVNAVAPFILASKLKPLMMRSPARDKHIVNVSAMEGQFARRTKTDKHPHTNMAKAALNMMTLTSAPGYAADGIFMNAVDTGWVTDEDPAIFANRKVEDLDFQPPLDIVDGAARICDPFFSAALTGAAVFGKFLKDYAPTEW